MFAQSTPRRRPTPTRGMEGVEDPERESHRDQGRSRANCKQL